VSPLATGLLTDLPCRAARVWSSGSLVLVLLIFTAATGMMDSGFGAIFFRFSLLDVVTTVGTVLVETVVGGGRVLVTADVVGTLPGMIGLSDTIGVM